MSAAPATLRPRRCSKEARQDMNRLARNLAVLLLFSTTMALPLAADAQVTCRKNIFGGQDCTGPGGDSSSMPNIFGGFDVTGPDGRRTTSRSNIFGGHDIDTPEGAIRSRSNIFGGHDYDLPDGRHVTSRKNIFGGQTFQGAGGTTLECQPNIFDGFDCR